MNDVSYASQHGSGTEPTSFVRGLPKAKLHVHHVGWASLDTIAILAQRHPGVVPDDLEDLRSFFEFRDFAHFIGVYRAVSLLVRTPEDVHLLTYEAACALAQQNVRYVELTCSPTPRRRGHGRAGVRRRARRCPCRGTARLQPHHAVDIGHPWGVRCAGRPDHPRHLLGLAAKGSGRFRPRGPEIGVPRPPFKPYFQRAVAAGLRSAPHAGETTGPQTVWDTIRLLGADRIGHGIRAVEDPELLDYLAQHGIALEVCLSSNVATRAVASLAQHPIGRLVDAGVTVTINSDDPYMFGSTLNSEYELAQDVLGLADVGDPHRGRSEPIAIRRGTVMQYHPLVCTRCPTAGGLCAPTRLLRPANGPLPPEASRLVGINSG